MYKIIGSGIAAAGLMFAAPAFAADIAPAPYPTKAPPAIIAAPSYDWSGFYIGGNAGYAWGDSSNPTGYASLSPDGWLGGGQIGVNYQFGNNVVIGAEADLQGSDINDNVGSYGTKMDYFGTVRGRVGYAFDNVLPYLTGGFAWGHNEVSFDGATSDNTHVGWTVGAGLEYGISPNWTVKAEYLYLDLGDEYYQSIGANTDVKANVGRVGVNYKF
ncbi:outer membrane protein [Ancylobacter terrae]|uniref:outer membrane protein n=1 Tax=Ancylobacter sp. sgz301288 TaxID=3342077 RepID=UPI00385D0469